MLRQSSPPSAAAELRQEGLFVPRAVTATGQAVGGEGQRDAESYSGATSPWRRYIQKQVVQTNRTVG